VACHELGVVTHPGDAQAKRDKAKGIFSAGRFVYEPASDTCLSGGPTVAAGAFSSAEPGLGIGG
jgi:hypothetical protein